MLSASVPAVLIQATYDESSDSAEGSDALARAVVELNLDLVLLGLFRLSACSRCCDLEFDIRV